MQSLPPRLLLVATVAFASGCPAPSPHQEPDALDYGITPVDEGPGTATEPVLCDLPGQPVPGAVVPRGMCIRRFAEVRTPRVLVVAPDGDLFVAAPNAATAGGAYGGPGAILVLSDDNRDGVAEVHTFAEALPDVHGLALDGQYLYFTTSRTIWRTPYSPGLRRERGPRESLGEFSSVEAERWTHGLARSVGGKLFATQGVYSANSCPDTPRNGVIQQLSGGGLDTVASGLRNPMYIRCHPSEEVCLAAELGDDGGLSYGAREKILAVRPDTNYGFPCCAGTDQSNPSGGGRFSCAAAAREEATFPLNDTPFGLDWERGRWPAPLRNALFVALHGSFYSSPPWEGARIVFATVDPNTHVPTGPIDPATHAPRVQWNDFVRGFDYRGNPLDRPADVAFSPDGRMYFADDQGGAVYWVAPEGLRLRIP
jgi:glucose/arabinose dehydrogenase